MSGMKVHFQIPECRLSSTKIVPMSGMKVYFQIPECRLSSTKVVKTN
ncbi:hypothetical protein [Prevotella bivia]|nr:hypothetical protein [Prevotella bivia]